MLEPAPFVPNWHVREMCKLLQEVTEGKHQNALINIPPDFAKLRELVPTPAQEKVEIEL